MINDYANEKGKIFCKPAPSIVQNINSLLKLGRDKKWDIIFVNTELGKSEKESILFKKWGAQAEKGTWACEVIKEIDKLDSDLVVPKTTFDGFYNTSLDRTLVDLKIKNVIVVGIHTHVCVQFTAMSAANRGYKVVAIEECMTTGFIDNHNSRLRLFHTHIGELYKINDFLTTEYKEYV